MVYNRTIGKRREDTLMFSKDDPYAPKLGHWMIAIILAVICSIIIL